MDTTVLKCSNLLKKLSDNTMWLFYLIYESCAVYVFFSLYYGIMF